jgi:hypothetical protein
MNINYSKGSNPNGLTNYVLSPEKQEQAQAEPILATNMVGLNAEELAEEFRFVHDYNPRVKKTMVHYSVSLSPQGAQEPSGNQRHFQSAFREDGTSGLSVLYCGAPRSPGASSGAALAHRHQCR